MMPIQQAAATRSTQSSGGGAVRACDEHDEDKRRASDPGHVSSAAGIAMASSPALQGSRAMQTSGSEPAWHSLGRPLFFIFSSSRLHFPLLWRWQHQALWGDHGRHRAASRSLRLMMTRRPDGWSSPRSHQLPLLPALLPLDPSAFLCPALGGRGLERAKFPACYSSSSSPVDDMPLRRPVMDNNEPGVGPRADLPELPPLDPRDSL